MESSKKFRFQFTSDKVKQNLPLSILDLKFFEYKLNKIKFLWIVRPSNIGSTRSVSSNIGGTYKPKFKRCDVQILPDFKGFGFAINSKIKPKFMIYSVDQNSPAYKANLRETDVIVQIDGKNIRKLKFDKVKQLLSDSQKKGRVEILAIDKEGYKYYKERKKKFSSKKLVTEDNTEPFYTITTSSGISESDRTRERNLSSDIGIYYLVYLFKSKLIIY